MSPESQSRPYSPDQAESSSSSGNISPQNIIIACPLKHLPPVPTNRPPVCPSPSPSPSGGGGSSSSSNVRTPRTRATHPSRLSHQVNLTMPSSYKNTAVEPGDDLYASLKAARHGQRAATFAGELHTTICVTPNSDSSSNFDDADPKYKSLNRDMMDDQPMYEDPQISGLQKEGGWDSDQEDMDSVYTATILQNTTGVRKSSANSIHNVSGVGVVPSNTAYGVGTGSSNTAYGVGAGSSNPAASSNSENLNQLFNTGFKSDTNTISSVPLSPTVLHLGSGGSNQSRPNTLIPVPIRRPSPSGQNAPRALSPAPVPRKFNSKSPPSPPSPNPRAQSHISLQLPILRGQSPASPMPNLVPLSRVSMDGEYVLPNEAFDGGILSPTDELSGSDQPDYIDIA